MRSNYLTLVSWYSVSDGSKGGHVGQRDFGVTYIELTTE